MSALKWLEAGATGSYGAVVEPCNFQNKFPVPALMMAHYLQGETLIEAYWKSVQMPGQGIFIGEPLARPFAGVANRPLGDGVVIEARVLAPGLYDVQAAPSMMGPYRVVAQSADLSFATRGEVAEVMVKEGDAVKAGDVIARLKSDAAGSDGARCSRRGRRQSR